MQLQTSSFQVTECTCITEVLVLYTLVRVELNLLVDRYLIQVRYMLRLRPVPTAIWLQCIMPLADTLLLQRGTLPVVTCLAATAHLLWMQVLLNLKLPEVM